MTIRESECPSYPISIYIAGDYDQARQLCREFCFQKGFCVHIYRADYIYTGGEEAGLVVGLINYPRFPVTPIELVESARSLTNHLIVGLNQHSATIQTPTETIWLSRRPDATSA